SEIQGSYRITGLAPGIHILTYRVTDACFNQSECTTILDVRDQSNPVAICDQHSVVALSGQTVVTTVPASDLSDGSYDACGPVTIVGRRMASCIDFDWTTNGQNETPDGLINTFDFGTEFVPDIPFSCCDLGAGPVIVEI